MQYDAATLLGSAFGGAFGGLHAGAPTLGDTAGGVTTASQIQALAAEGLGHGRVGVPAVLAVLGLSGVTAAVVRRLTLQPRRATTGSSGAADPQD